MAASRRPTHRRAHDTRVPRGAILVFAKYPHRGTVKTRLAPRVGMAGATRLATAFLRDTWRAVQQYDGADQILVWTGTAGNGDDEQLKDEARLEEAAARLGLDPVPRVWSQGGGDLGERLQRAMRRALRRWPWVVVLGTDSPHLPSEYVHEAMRVLGAPASTNTDGKARRCVLGPSADGGYYLIGATHLAPKLLADLPWSAANTFEATERRMQARGHDVHRLPAWWDVDEPEDIERLFAVLQRTPAAAPETWRTLREMGWTQTAPSLQRQEAGKV